MSRFNNKHFINVIALFTANLVRQLSNFFIVMLFANTLGVKYFGQFAYISTMGLLIASLSDAGLGVYGMREIALTQERGAQERTIKQIFSSKAIAGCVLASITGFLTMEYGLMLSLVASSFTVFLCLDLNWILFGVDKSFVNSKIDLIGNFIRIAISLIFYFVGNAERPLILILGLMLGLCAGAFFRFVAKVRYLHSLNYSIYYLPSLREIFDIYKKALPLSIMSISGSIYSYMDIVIIRWIGGEKNVGIYKIAQTIYGVGTGFVSLLWQASIGKVQEVNQVRSALIINLLVGGSISATIFLLSPLLVSLIGGAAYSDSAYLLRILSIVVLIVVIEDQFIVLRMLPLKKDKTIAGLRFAGAIFTAILMALMMKLWGLPGICWALLISKTLTCVLTGCIAMYMTKMAKS